MRVNINIFYHIETESYDHVTTLRSLLFFIPLNYVLKPYRVLKDTYLQKIVKVLIIIKLATFAVQSGNYVFL